jgi:hypothetical protein
MATLLDIFLILRKSFLRPSIVCGSTYAVQMSCNFFSLLISRRVVSAYKYIDEYLYVVTSKTEETSLANQRQ